MKKTAASLTEDFLSTPRGEQRRANKGAQKRKAWPASSSAGRPASVEILVDSES